MEINQQAGELEELRKLFNQEVLRRLGEMLAPALSSKSTTDDKSNSHFTHSQSGSSDQIVFLMEQPRQITTTLDTVESQYNEMQRKCNN